MDIKLHSDKDLILHQNITSQNEEKKKRAQELSITNQELVFQNNEKEKRAQELRIANKELAFQNSEREKRAQELSIANKELAFQNEEKEKRAQELIIANKELTFQNDEKEKRAQELIVANKELAFQNEEKEKRAEELIIANKELAFQNEEKEKRAQELNDSITAENIQRQKAEIYKERLAAIVESSQDAIISKSLDSTIQTWNKGAEKMFGYRAIEAIGKPISIIIPLECRDEDKDIVNLIRQNKIIAHFETLRNKKNGEKFFVSLTVSPLKDPEGNIIGVSKIARDITIQKNFELKLIDANKELEFADRQLKEVNKELEAFSYSVSHDLRTPLRAIGGYSAMLQEDYALKLDAEANRIINVIVCNTNKMGELIDNLLSFSKMARLEAISDTVDMSRLAKTCTEELMQTEDQTKYSFTTHAISPCAGDVNMLKQVWQNLIGNAIKYSSKAINPHIEIGSFDKTEVVVYYVKDNGTGFDMKYADKLFGVFQRLHRNDEFEGTGLGLALAKRIVSKHDGEIWAESVLHKGTTFYFSIPKTICK
jgi:PAS domain S-box-containing protein